LVDFLGQQLPGKLGPWWLPFGFGGPDHSGAPGSPLTRAALRCGAASQGHCGTIDHRRCQQPSPLLFSDDERQAFSG